MWASAEKTVTVVASQPNGCIPTNTTYTFCADTPVKKLAACSALSEDAAGAIARVDMH
jgi:hypothetical protein